MVTEYPLIVFVCMQISHIPYATKYLNKIFFKPIILTRGRIVTPERGQMSG